MSILAHQLGQRIQELRHLRRRSIQDLGLQRGSMSRIELGNTIPSLGYLERIGEALEVSPWRFFLADAEFDVMLALEDTFTWQVRLFLKFLNAEQKKLILVTLAAAPKQKPWTAMGRPRSGSTVHPTLNG